MYLSTQNKKACLAVVSVVDDHVRRNPYLCTGLLANQNMYVFLPNA